MVDSFEAQRLTQQLQQLMQVQQQLSDNMLKSFDAWKRKGEDAAKDVQEKWMETLPISELEKIGTDYVNTTVGAFDKMFDALTDQANNFSKALKNALTVGGADAKFDIGKNMVGAAQAATSGNLNQMMATVLAGIPGGSLIMLMLLGKQQETKYAALGQQAAQAMQQAGDVAKGVAGKLGGDIKRLVLSGMAQEGDITAIRSAFAMSGVTDEMANSLVDVDIGVKGLSNSATNASLAMDKLFQLGAGTSAKTMGEITQNSNLAFADSVKLYKDMSLASREAGMSQQMFIGTVMQASSALRFQAADTRSLGDALLKVSQVYESQGMQAQRAGALASGGIGAVTNAIKGMSVGMMSHIGKMIDPSATGVQSVVRMERGFRGKAGTEDYLEKTMSSMLKIGEQANQGRGEEELLFTLERMFPQMGPEGADALVAMKKDIAGGMKISEAAEKHGGAMKKALETEAQKMDVMIRIMQQLQSSIKDIGSGILTIIANSLKMIGSTLQFGFSWIMSWIKQKFGEANAEKEAKYRDDLTIAYGKDMKSYAEKIGKGATTVKDGVVGAGGALGDLGSVFLDISNKSNLDNVPVPEHSKGRPLDDRTPQQKAIDDSKKVRGGGLGAQHMIRLPSGNRFQVNILEMGYDGTTEVVG